MKTNLKKIICLILVIVMTAVPLATTASAEDAPIFSDVPEDHWAYEYIKDFIDLKIVDGYPDGTFKPEKEVTTAEFIKMASIIYWMAFGGEYKGTLYENGENESKLEQLFPDFGEFREHWAGRYVESLKSVIGAYQYTLERLDSAITREEAAYILFNCYILTNKYDSKREQIDSTESYIKGFEDESDISETWWDYRWCLNACIQYGFINGFEDGTLRPQGKLTRAQAAKIIYIYYEKLYSYMKYLKGDSWEWEH